MKDGKLDGDGWKMIKNDGNKYGKVSELRENIRKRDNDTAHVYRHLHIRRARVDIAHFHGQTQQDRHRPTGQT